MIEQILWDAFIILTFVGTALGCIIVTVVNLFRKGW